MAASGLQPGLPKEWSLASVVNRGDVDDWTAGDGSTSELLAPAALEKTDPPGDRWTGIAAAMAIIAVAFVAILFVSTLGSGDESDTQNSVTAPPTTVAPTAAVASTGAPTTINPSASSAQTASAVSPGDENLRSAEIALAFADELDTDAVKYGIAYVAQNDFVVLDARGISTPDPEIAQEFRHVSQLAMLTGDASTWAVDAADRDRSYLVSNMYVVVDAERPDTIAVVDLENQSVGLLSSGLPIPGITLPAGAETIVVQQRGVLVLPRTGGTFELSGTASSLVRLSDDRAVSASTGATAYERCDDDLRCEYFVVRTDSDDEFPLSVPPNSVLDLSPSGEWVVARTEGSTFLVNVDSETLVPLGDGAIEAVRWSPDDAFVAIARGEIIEILFPSELRSVDLLLTLHCS